MNKWFILILVVLLSAIIYLRVVQKNYYAPASQPVQSIIPEPEGVPLPPEASEYSYRYIIPPLPSAGESVRKLSAAEEAAAKARLKKEETYQKQVKKDQEKLISDLNKDFEAVFKKWKKRK
ncbi:MAG: hypothetical protein A2X28_02935 [Elusimicrobia bacterium GWA2_56_46]|jgi:hypothetical protein|nr:MAG: hypothetical protein A2X28_02935 [Elusimicrobia bacterium GWA2_56_46]OGR54184.1 MAG: hypothetical protein A2X39_08880 [Elusimicrobia bacterium GWC2_56_31]HBB68252.1 hypothetical protein [Elusimicrobiota bacterium]HBW21761.1 hypothetical protein [Elusimicrobiota bacterium]